MLVSGDHFEIRWANVNVSMWQFLKYYYVWMYCGTVFVGSGLMYPSNKLQMPPFISWTLWRLWESPDFTTCEVPPWFNLQFDWQVRSKQRFSEKSLLAESKVYHKVIFNDFHTSLCWIQGLCNYKLVWNQTGFKCKENCILSSIICLTNICKGSASWCIFSQQTCFQITRMVDFRQRNFLQFVFGWSQLTCVVLFACRVTCMGTFLVRVI